MSAHGTNPNDHVRITGGHFDDGGNFIIKKTAVVMNQNLAAYFKRDYEMTSYQNIKLANTTERLTSGVIFKNS